MAKSNIRNIKFIAWERSGCCRAFQATAPIYDNWVWLARACKFLCAPVRTQLLPTPARRAPVCAGPLHGVSVGVFIAAVPVIKRFAWGEGNSGGHVLRETTIRSLCGLVCTLAHHALVDAGEREISCKKEEEE